MNELELQLADFAIPTLGKPTINTNKFNTLGVNFVREDDPIIFPIHQKHIQKYIAGGLPIPVMEIAGPRAKILFDPSKTKVGIITCGGLCPGLNSVIRAIVTTCSFFYGIKTIYGFKNGYRGLNPAYKLAPILLTPDMVDSIHDEGGTILSSSRGEQDTKVMVEYLKKMDVSILFVIGGDGTMRGAQALVTEIARRKLNISIIGIPKTIDNDIALVERSFGFETAVEEARHAIYSAHAESKGAPNGVGLVKLMGRESGFIASAATLASAVVNFCFIPEVPFKLDGETGFLKVLEKRLIRKQHAVIVLAEGAGQDLIKGDKASYDLSGNVVLKDIGYYMKSKIEDYFKKIKMEVNLKYIDPSYIIRSVPPTADDNIYCQMLGQNAVHAALSGRTAMVVAYHKDHYVHLPMSLVIRERKKINPGGRIWKSVLDTTRQPLEML